MFLVFSAICGQVLSQAGEKKDLWHVLIFTVMLFLGANFARTGPRFSDLQYSEFWAVFI